RLETKLHQDGSSHRHWCPETRCAFKESSKRKCNQDNLNTRIRRECSQAVPQYIEETFLHRELVKKDQVQNNPANGKQSISRAINRRRRSQLQWHLVDAHC